MEIHRHLFGTKAGGAYGDIKGSANLYNFLTTQIGGASDRAVLDKISNLFKPHKALEGYSKYSNEDIPLSIRYAPMHLRVFPDMPATIQPFCAIGVAGYEVRENKARSAGELDRDTFYTMIQMFHCEAMYTSGEYNYLDYLFGLKPFSREDTALVRNGKRDLSNNPRPDKVIVKMREEDKLHVLTAVDAIYAGKDVVIRLEPKAFYNNRAKQILTQIYSMLQPRLAVEVGYASYQDPAGIDAIRKGWSVRIFVVPGEESLDKVSMDGVVVVDLAAPVRMEPTPFLRILNEWWNMEWDKRIAMLEELFRDTKSTFNDPKLFVERSQIAFAGIKELNAWTAQPPVQKLATIEDLKAELDAHESWKYIPWAKDAAVNSVKSHISKLSAVAFLKAFEAENKEERTRYWNQYQYGKALSDMDASTVVTRAADHAKTKQKEADDFLFAKERTDYQNQIAAQKTAYENELAAQMAAYKNELVAQKTHFENEIATQKTSYEGKLEKQKGSYETELSTQKDSYENQLREQQASHESQIAIQKTSYENQMAAQKGSYENQLSTQKTSYENQLGSQKTRYEGELSAQKADHEKHIADKNHQIAELNNACAAAGEKVTCLRNELRGANDRIKSLEDGVDEVRRKAEELKERDTKLRKKEKEMEKARSTFFILIGGAAAAGALLVGLIWLLVALLSGPKEPAVVVPPTTTTSPTVVTTAPTTEPTTVPVTEPTEPPVDLTDWTAQSTVDEIQVRIPQLQTVITGDQLPLWLTDLDNSYGNALALLSVNQLELDGENGGFAVLYERIEEQEVADPETTGATEATEETETTNEETVPTEPTVTDSIDSTEPTETATFVMSVRMIYTSADYVIAVYGDGDTAVAALEVLKQIQADALELHDIQPDEITMEMVDGEQKTDISALFEKLELAEDWWRSITAIHSDENACLDVSDTLGVEQLPMVCISAAEDMYCVFDFQGDYVQAQALADSLKDGQSIVVDGYVLVKIALTMEQN